MIRNSFIPIIDIHKNHMFFSENSVHTFIGLEANSQKSELKWSIYIDNIKYMFTHINWI